MLLGRNDEIGMLRSLLLVGADAAEMRVIAEAVL